MMIAIGESELPEGFSLGDGSAFFCVGAGAGAGFAVAVDVPTGAAFSR